MNVSVEIIFHHRGLFRIVLTFACRKGIADRGGALKCGHFVLREREEGIIYLFCPNGSSSCYSLVVYLGVSYFCRDYDGL